MEQIQWRKASQVSHKYNIFSCTKLVKFPSNFFRPNTKISLQRASHIPNFSIHGMVTQWYGYCLVRLSQYSFGFSFLHSLFILSYISISVGKELVQVCHGLFVIPFAYSVKYVNFQQQNTVMENTSFGHIFARSVNHFLNLCRQTLGTKANFWQLYKRSGFF